MSTITKDLGAVTAYAYAKEKGYTGTEAEFAELMASYASVAEQASQSAQTASEKAQQASASATSASQSADTASASAQTAQTAQQTATAKASEASQSASTASNAATSAGTSAQTATTAAATATTKAGEASESATTATTAKTDAETARDAAAQSASEAAASAESIDPDEFNRKIYAAFPTDTANGAVANFPDGADGIPMKDVVVHIEPVQEGSGDPSPDNVRPISGWDSVVVSHSGEDTSNPTTYPITFPTEAGTVYGGYVDVTGGELVVDKALTTITDNITFSGLYVASNGVKRLLSSPTAPFQSHAIACDKYLAYYQQNYISDSALNAISVTSDGRYVITSSFIQTATTVTEAKNAMFANGNIQLVYELAEPIHYPLTSNQINSLLGHNNIWADTGDTEVEYRADTKLYIEKLTQPEEYDMIADSAINSGQFFMIGNALYRALTNIASGATITVGTNAERVSLADALNLVNT